jgi:limonene-1,2-epoxide hydrolase
MNAKEVVKKFWQTMETNDFAAAAKFLTEDFRCLWPQSSELIEGRENFIKINENYPTRGKWHFEILFVMAENDRVVTEVEVKNDEVTARVITFHEVENGLIKNQVEYWPENFAAQTWRQQWVRIVD